MTISRDDTDSHRYAHATLYRLRHMAETEAVTALAGVNYRDYEAGLDRVCPSGEDDQCEWEETT